jgi:hypothetical protein
MIKEDHKAGDDTAAAMRRPADGESGGKMRPCLYLLWTPGIRREFFCPTGLSLLQFQKSRTSLSVLINTNTQQAFPMHEQSRRIIITQLFQRPRIFS